jgi:hypothetical protein
MDATNTSKYNLPVPESRMAPRKRLAIEVHLQFAGRHRIATKLRDLSVSGFSASTQLKIEVASQCWLTLPGRPPLEASVVWCEGGLVGCAFVTPIAEITYDAILERWEAQARH